MAVATTVLAPDRMAGAKTVVGQALSCAGARLHHEVPALSDRVGYRVGHLDLAWPVLTAPGKRGGDPL